jgi:hypothetical protein
VTRRRLLAALGVLAALPAWAADTAPVLHLHTDRIRSEQLEVAAEAIARGEPASAIPILDALWNEADHVLVDDGSVVRPARQKVTELVRRLAKQDQQRFWDRVQVTAKVRARDGRIDSPTPAAFAALWRRAMSLRDRGEFALAAAAFQKAARHPSANASDRVLADAIAVDALARIHGPEVVAKWLAERDSDVRTTTMALGNEESTVEGWLRRHDVADRAKVSRSPLHGPFSRPIWQHEVEISPELEPGLEQAADRLREIGLARLPTVRPVAVGTRILAATQAGLECLDARSGELLWKTATRSGGDRASTALAQQNPIFRQNLLAMLAAQSQTNTLLGRMTCDGHTVYHIEESHPLTDPAQAAFGDALVAYDLETGHRKWRIGGSPAAKDPTWRSLGWNPQQFAPDPPDAAFSVCGPPLILDGRLYLLGEIDSELVFLAVDRDSFEVEWTAVIGDLRPNASRSLVRNFSSCALVWTGESIVCATNCGALFAADPVTEQIAWIAPLPVDVWPETELAAADLAAEAALRSWRETSLHLAGDQIVCVSRESEAAVVLELISGRQIAAIPRDQAMLCLGVATIGPEPKRGIAVLLEPMAVRAHDVATGALLWRTVIGEVQGHGAITGNRLVQPLSSGAHAVIDVRDGRRLPGRLSSDAVWGNLFVVDGHWFAAGDGGLRRFPDLTSARESPPDTNPLTRAERDLEVGDFASARSLLKDQQPDAAREILRQVDLAELYFSPERAGDIRQGLLERSASREEKGEALAALAQAHLQMWQPAGALANALDGAELGLNGDRLEFGLATRRVGWARVFQGLLAEALRTAPPAEFARLDALLSARWQAARDSGDPFALQQLYQRWRSLPWARRRLPEAAEPVFLGSNLTARDLMLREIMADRSPSVAVSAAWKLRQEWISAGFPEVAQDVALRLYRNAPGALVADRITIRQALRNADELEPLRDLFHHGPADPWPRRTPRVDQTNDFYDEAYQFPLAIESDSAEPWDRIDVTIDRRGRVLRFCGGGFAGAWTITLPRSASPLQIYPITYRGWGLGRLLIARIGRPLLAMTPFDEHGGPSAEVLGSLVL